MEKPRAFQGLGGTTFEGHLFKIKNRMSKRLRVTEHSQREILRLVNHGVHGRQLVKCLITTRMCHF